ncbi:sulfatase-like hydrolase/transferase [Paenibacillus sp. 1P07SE]|uniref:sulfatase-like hydrolase/transferase n=1 Tax=Paenibacillus sp. 1P07SE TaxID=3132209 RepID=UPI0039A59B48
MSNVLLIMVDQQRYDCLGYSGARPVHTPNIDRLAGEGAWFDNAYTPIPLCCPARQAFLNGRRPEAIGGLWNYGITLPVPALEPTEYAWPRELQARGYRMGYVGKWHVHPEHDPTRYGYDDYVSEQDYAAFRMRQYPDVRYENGWLGEADPIPLEDARTHWLADRAIGLLDNYAGSSQPWHLRLDLSEPHLPCRPAGKFADMYPAGKIPRWGSFDERFDHKPYIQKQQLYNWGIEQYRWEDWAPIVARYYGAVSQTDDAIGKVLERLEQTGDAENTIVVYTTDHGDLCGGHRMMDKHYVMYEDVVKVPLIIRWPGRIAQGLRVSEFVYNLLDVPPTILECLGAEAPPGSHGRSLLPLLSNGRASKTAGWRQEIVSTYNGQQFGLYSQRMIRDERWKYVWNPTDLDELYDLREDPHELTNQISNHELRPIVRHMRERMYAVLHQDGDGLVNSSWMRNQLLQEDRKIDGREGVIR